MELQSVERGRSVPMLHDPADFEAFVRRQHEGLVRSLRRRIPLEQDARDLAQGGLSRLKRYRVRAPTTWAARLRMAIHALDDRLRRGRSHRESLHTTLDSGLAEPTSPAPLHEQGVAIQQELAVLQRVLLGLPLRCRQIYLLNRIEGMSYIEIADHCGISVKAVEKHISKALRLLRERLAPFDRETSRP
jgi:RNA polymerase sigma factor (sigma-70 family)